MLVDDLLALEHQGWESLCTGDGASFYGHTMTPDGMMVLAHGQALTKEEVIASLSDAPPWERYEIRDAQLIPLDPSGAILTYTGSAHRHGDSTPFRALMSTIYVRQDDEWRIALYQQTPVPA